jgi:hypothetical protein
MAGLVPAIHVVRRIERPKASNKAKSFAIARLCWWPRQYEIRFRGGIAWMAGTSPAMTTGAQRRDRQRRYKSQIVPQARAGLPLDSALLASLDDHAEIDPLRVRFEMTVLIGS